MSLKPQVSSLKPAVLVFDMDGVLVDVTGSYREAIRATVEHFTGRQPNHEEIQERKNRGGFNNDWELSWTMIRELGREAPYKEVVEVFQRLFVGEEHNGLIQNERWLPRAGLLERLAPRYRLAIFTGRLRREAEFTLRRFVPGLRFDPLVAMDDVERQKPDPEGLDKIRAACGDDLLYVGDSIDDCRAAAAADVRFVGVVAPGLPYRETLTKHFQQAGAAAIIPHIDELEKIL